MKNIVVYCGSNTGNKSIYEKQTIDLGKKICAENLGLIYGGAKVGLMGILADTVLENDGIVIGVIPNFLSEKEIIHNRLSKTIHVETMHERKAKMNDLADAVIALPGGFGTLEELFEMITWSQLGIHKKPIAILNINGFFNPLIDLLRNMVDDCFLKEDNKESLIISDNVDELFSSLNSYKYSNVSKWI
ncbi:MAG: TIGR00730 family Rossman fold protein [Marinifilaceae bacterium]|jgi:uncharacterized protein (TIGR00730 family)|nr:TIGR00730 family Rossman fold protein [Marinifilaceae bacterium]